MGELIQAAARFKRNCDNCSELTHRDELPYCRAEVEACVAAGLPVKPLFGNESYSCGERYLPKHLARRRQKRDWQRLPLRAES